MGLVRATDHYRTPRPAIGTLYIREGTNRELVHAKGRARSIMQMLLTDRLKYVALDGEPVRWRKALIRHYEIKTEHHD
jgi:hypothetical protein